MSFTLTSPADVSTLVHLGYVPNVDFMAGDAGGGQIFVQWLQGVEPAAADVQAAAFDALKSTRIDANRAECERRIFARYPAGRQLSALAGLYDGANVATMTDWIAANIAAENTAADLIEAATTVAEVEAVTVAWPA